MNSPGDTDVNFTGLSGAECEVFVQAVRKHAFAAGKARDMEYTADYAATCMAGPALRWFDQLDLDTQTNWNLLRPALLARYPTDFRADSQPKPPTLAFIPTPAAAPPSTASATSTAHAHLNPSQNTTRSPRRGAEPSESDSSLMAGRIIVAFDGDLGKKRYINARLNSFRFFSYTEEASLALQVQYQPSSLPLKPFHIKLPSYQNDTLGAEHWYDFEGSNLAEELGPTSVLRASLGPVKQLSNDPAELDSVLWTIDENKTLSAIWNDASTGTSYPLDILFLGEYLYLAGNAKSFINSASGSPFHEARLAFESSSLVSRRSWFGRRTGDK